MKILSLLSEVFLWFIYFFNRAACVCMGVRVLFSIASSFVVGIWLEIAITSSAVCIKDLTSMRSVPYQYICLSSLFLYLIILFSTLLCDTHANTAHTQTQKRIRAQTLAE